MHTIDLHELLVIGRLIFVGIFIKIIGLMAWRPSLGFFLRPLGVPNVITESNMLSDTMITKGRNLLTRHRGHPCFPILSMLAEGESRNPIRHDSIIGKRKSMMHFLIFKDKIRS